jgi:hypothetical protein
MPLWSAAREVYSAPPMQHMKRVGSVSAHEAPGTGVWKQVSCCDSVLLVLVSRRAAAAAVQHCESTGLRVHCESMCCTSPGESMLERLV